MPFWVWIHQYRSLIFDENHWQPLSTPIFVILAVVDVHFFLLVFVEDILKSNDIKRECTVAVTRKYIPQIGAAIYWIDNENFWAVHMTAVAQTISNYL